MYGSLTWASDGLGAGTNVVRARKGKSMFYNYSLVGYFILLFVAFVATLNGLTILKTRTFEMPGGPRVDGHSAVWGGLGLLALGVLSFAVLLWSLVG